MPDRVYKNDELRDDDTSLTVHKLGPEEKFAGTVLKSLKEKIEDARDELKSVEQEAEETLEQAESEKQQILEQARERADEIVEEAELEAETIISEKEEKVAEAREEGYKAGYNDGTRQAQEDTIEMIEQGETILQEARRKRNSLIGELDEEFVSLLSQLAGRVVREYVEADPDTVLRTVKQAVEEVRDQQQVTVVLHPKDLVPVQTAVDSFLDQHPSLSHVNLVEDDRLERGGCRIRTDYGDIEATLQAQVDHLSRSLLNLSVHEHLQEDPDSADCADPE